MIEKSIKILYIVLFIILIFMGTMSFIITANMTFDYTIDTEGISIKSDNILINALGIIFFIILIYGCYRISKRLHEKTTVILVLSIILILGSIWVIAVGNKLPIRADQEKIFDIAKQFINNDFTALNENNYIGKFPYQLGMVTLLEILIRIFNSEAILAFRLINVIAITVFTFYIYKITDIMFHKETSNRLVLILTLLFSPIIMTTTFVYGNVIGLAFGTMAIFYALKFINEKSIKYAIILIVTISLAVVIKSNYKIYLVGIIILLLIEVFKNFNIKLLSVAILTIICSTMIQTGLNIYIENRSNTRIKDGIPMISFVYMGIQEGRDGRAYGWYSGVTHYIYYISSSNTQIAKEKSLELIEHRIGEFMHKPEYTIQFFTGKFISTWCEPTYQSIWINAPLDKYKNVSEEINNDRFLISMYSGKINRVLTKYLDVFQIIIYLITASYIYEEYKNVNSKNAILGIIFFRRIIISFYMGN